MDTNPLKSILQEQRRNAFSALAGSSLYYSIPLRENVLNAILSEERASQLAKGKNIPDIRLSLRDGSFEAGNLPLIGSLVFTIPERIDFPNDPILRLTPQGFMGRLIGGVIGALGIGPDFVRVASGVVFIDLGKLASAKGHANLLPLLKPVRLRCLPGVLWLEGELQVPE